jgi:hypothetical protein
VKRRSFCFVSLWSENFFLRNRLTLVEREVVRDLFRSTIF